MNLRKAFVVVFGALAAAIMPPPAMGLPEWMEQNLVLVDGPKASQTWQRAEAPYMVGILRCLEPEHPATSISVMKGVQVSFTTGAMGWLGYIADRVPAKAMTVFPTVNTVKDFNREKLQPSIDEARKSRKAWAGKIREQKSRDGQGSTAVSKKFQGGSLVLTGANSAADLQSKTIKYLFADEIDQWPEDLEGQGDPMTMADDRQTSYHRSGDYKKLQGGTPTIKGLSRAGDAFRAGDQRYYHVPCPHCGERQKLDWENLRYSLTFPHNAEYECVHCHALIQQHEQPGMIRAALAYDNDGWVAEAPGPGKQPSFHINALYSLLTTWDELVKRYIAAKDNPNKLKGFWNRWLALEWEEKGEAPDAIKLLARLEDTPAQLVPPRCLFLTMGVDVQGNRIEWSVWGWGIGCAEEWLIDKGVIGGDTKNLGTFQPLAQIWRREYRNALGRKFTLEAGAIDTGHNAHTVYAFVRQLGDPRFIAIKGYSGQNQHLHPYLGGPSAMDIDYGGRKIKGGVMLWPVGTWSIKSEFYANLRVTIEGPVAGSYPPGYVHLPAQLVDQAYLLQLTAEHLVERESRGRKVMLWDKPRDQPNEGLDKRVYARAAASHAGADRLTVEEWRNLAAERGAPPDAAQLALELWAGLPQAKPAAAHDSTGEAPPAGEQQPAAPSRSAAAPAASAAGRTVSGHGRKVEG